MTRGAAILLAATATVTLAGCASLQPKSRIATVPCLAGQEYLRTAQLFLGRQNPAWPVTEPEVRRFVDQEIIPRFPQGVTVLDGGGQWREDQMVRDAVKVVSLLLPADGAFLAKIDSVRSAYRTQFRQDTVLIVAEPACIAG